MEERDTIRDSKIVAERCMDVLKIGRANLDGACRSERILLRCEHVAERDVEDESNEKEKVI